MQKIEAFQKAAHILPADFEHGCGSLVVVTGQSEHFLDELPFRLKHGIVEVPRLGPAWRWRGREQTRRQVGELNDIC